MKEHSLELPTEDTSEYRRPRNNSNRGKWLALWVAIATIAVGVPTVLGWVKTAFRVWDAPDQIVALAKHQAEQDEQITELKTSQREIRAGLNRILSAMHLDTIKDPKEKDIQP